MKISRDFHIQSHGIYAINIKLLFVKIINIKKESVFNKENIK